MDPGAVIGPQGRFSLLKEYKKTIFRKLNDGGKKKREDKLVAVYELKQDINA